MGGPCENTFACGSRMRQLSVIVPFVHRPFVNRSCVQGAMRNGLVVSQAARSLELADRFVV
jgi:hypothetical protein